MGCSPLVLEEASDLPVPAGWVLHRAQLPRQSTDTETNETRTTKPTLFLRAPGVSLLLSLSLLVPLGASACLIHGSWVDTEDWWLQAGGRVVEVRLFDPQQGDPVLALRVLARVPALEPHQENGDDQDAKDGEGVEEHKVEEGVVGADDRLQAGACKETQDGHISWLLCNIVPKNFFRNKKPRHSLICVNGGGGALRKIPILQNRAAEESCCRACFGFIPIMSFVSAREESSLVQIL